MSFPGHSALLCIFTVVLVNTVPSFAQKSGGTSEAGEPEKLQLSVVNNSCILDEIQKKFESFQAKSAKARKENRENLRDDTVKLFMAKMLEVPDTKAGLKSFDRGNFVKVTYVTYLAADYFYSFILCRLHLLTNSPWLQLLPSTLRIGSKTVAQCYLAEGLLSRITSAYSDIVEDKLASLLPEITFEEVVPKPESPEIQTKASVTGEGRPTSPMKKEIWNWSDRGQIEYFKNVHFGKSEYTFLKTVHVLVKYIQRLNDLHDYIRDFINAKKMRLAPKKSKSKKFETDDEGAHDEKHVEAGLGSTNVVGDINIRDDQGTEPRISETGGDVDVRKGEETEAGISATASGEDVSNQESESETLSTVDEEDTRRQADLQIYLESYDMIHDEKFVAQGRYLKDYFVQIEIDGGPFDIHGDIDDFRAEDANGEDEVETDRLQITAEVFTWKNAWKIIKIGDKEDCKRISNTLTTDTSSEKPSKFANMHPFKLLSLLEEYRMAMLYRFERQVPTVGYPIILPEKGFSYPVVEFVWNKDNEDEPDFKFNIKN